MTEEIKNRLSDPFYTTRTTRKVGMGIPLLKLAAEQAGGGVSIESRHFSEYPDTHGTSVLAFFKKNVIDFTPLGDVISTVSTLIQGHPDIDLYFEHKISDKTVILDTREIRAVLEDIPLDSFEVIVWIRENLAEQYNTSEFFVYNLLKIKNRYL